MKKLLLILSLACLLAGCKEQAAEVPQVSEVPSFTAVTEADTVPAVLEPTAETQETLALSYDAYQVAYNVMMDGGTETAEFQGIGPDGSLLWTYETDAYPLAQLSQITPLGSFQGTYYLLEGGTVVALDIATGRELFENPDFGGAPCDTAILIDDYGYLYLSGYDGPDFFAMDPQGHTVKQISSLSDEFCRPFEIRQEENRLVISMESDNQGNSGNFPCYVDMDWLPQAEG